MKFALALVAGMVSAVKVQDIDYILEDATEVTLTEDGYWYVSEYDQYDDYYYDDYYCDWIWEDCSWMYYRSECYEGEGDTDCGWFYWDDWSYSEFWVTCDEFNSWYECNEGLYQDDYYYDDYYYDDYYYDDYYYDDYYYDDYYYDDYYYDDYYCEWIWEDCSGMYYRNECYEGEGDTDCGWMYWDDWNWTEFWVTCDEFNSWEYCQV